MRMVFGSLGASLSRDLVLDGMDGSTAEEALARGVDPQKVWDAVWVTAELEDKYRFPHRIDRPKPQ